MYVTSVAVLATVHKCRAQKSPAHTASARIGQGPFHK